MNINRNNYETFFLLYVDNELLPAERKAVELFVQENTDLQIELDMLQQTALPPVEITINKAHLYKKSAFNEQVQEDLILHLDNELDAAKIKHIEAAIETDESVKREWEILKQTKLQPEAVAFENKRILYRHEKGQLITMRFWRMAAAAAVIIGLLFTGISIYRNYENREDAYVQGEPKPKQPALVTPDAEIIDNVTPQTNEVASVDNGDAQPKTSAPATSSDVQNKPVMVANSTIVTEKKINKTRLENINAAESNKTVTAFVSDKRSDKVFVNMAPEELPERSVTAKVKSPSVPIIDYNSVQAIPENSYATTAAYNEAPENDNKILYMSEERLNRSKVGGIFRKVKRVIERSTAIKTGNGVTIGGFEIALK